MNHDVLNRSDEATGSMSEDVAMESTSEHHAVDSASLALLGGSVWDGTGWLAEHSVLIRHGRVVAIEPAHRLRHVEGARRIDTGGQFVMPAFVDAHVHLAATGFAALGCDLSVAASAEEAEALLGAHAETSELPVVLAHSWDETNWPASLTRAQVDRAVGDRPAYVARVDVHSAFASTALLRAASEIPGQPGVETMIGFSDQGPLTREAHHGVRLAEQKLLAHHRSPALATALRQAAKAGIASVHELGAPHLSQELDFDLAALMHDPAPTVIGYWGALDMEPALRRGLPGAAGDLCIDGAIGSRTAALLAPYHDAPSQGFLYLDAPTIASHIVACTRAGIQAGFHVIGDGGTQALLGAFARAESEVGREAIASRRHRIEHLEMIDAAGAELLAGWGVIASVQPVFDARWGGPDGLYARRLGERAVSMNPFATLIDAGVTVAFGSDSPVTPLSGWAAIEAAMTHHNPAERLSFAQAVHAHTVAAWLAAGPGVEPGGLGLDQPAYVAVWDSIPTGSERGPLPEAAVLSIAGRQVIWS